jgi:hypothetical protein
MKYFKPSSDFWVCKVNFVDENNLLVGFDYSSLCCENFGWYINKSSDELFLDDNHTSKHINDFLEGWVFDPQYFKETDNKNDVDSFGTVKNQAVFRLVKGDEELFLHLFNVHNGYYSHGFEMSNDGAPIHAGML